MNNEFIIKDEATPFTEKELRAAINFLTAGRATPYDPTKDPWFIQAKWFMEAEDVSLSIKRCKRCVYFRYTTNDDVIKEGICDKDQEYCKMIPFYDEMEVRCKYYACKDDFLDKYPVTRNDKE